MNALIMIVLVLAIILELSILVLFGVIIYAACKSTQFAKTKANGIKELFNFVNIFKNRMV